MHILRRDHEVSAFIENHPDESITSTVARRMSELTGDEFTMEDLVFFIILEPGDTLRQLESAIGRELHSPEGFPQWELMEEHSGLYEIVMVLDDTGFGAEILIPKEGIDPELSDLCRRHSTPSRESVIP
jgi:hypothetical protein